MFHQARVIFKVSEMFNNKKNELVGLSIAKIKYPEQHRNLLRQLVQLIEYEKQIFIKIKDFNFNHADSEVDLDKIKDGIKAITDVD